MHREVYNERHTVVFEYHVDQQRVLFPQLEHLLRRASKRFC